MKILVFLVGYMKFSFFYFMLSISIGIRYNRVKDRYKNVSLVNNKLIV